MNRNVNHQEAPRRPLRPAASAGAAVPAAAPAPAALRSASAGSVASAGSAASAVAASASAGAVPAPAALRSASAGSAASAVAASASAGAVPAPAAPAAPAGSAPVWRRAVGRWAAAALLAVALPACIDDADLCGPDDGSATAPAPLLLSLQISAPAPGATRASAPGAASSAATRADVHPSEGATEAENYLAFDQGDYQVLIFDGFGRFLQTFNPQWTLSSWPNGSATYNTTLIGPIALEFPEIQIMVLANCATFDEEWGTHFPDLPGANLPNNFVQPTLSPTGQSFYYPNWQYGTFLSDFYANSVSIYQQRFLDSFTYPAAVANGVATTWQPSYAEGAADNRGIPMFGLSDKISLANFDAPNEIDQDVLADAAQTLDPDAKVLHGDIKMLRALAKIEVVNNTPQEEPATLSNVALSHYSENGRVIPDVVANPSWKDQGVQISVPSLIDPDPTRRDLAFFETTNRDGKQTWMAYVPEMAIGGTDLSAPAEEYRPHVDVYVDGGTTPYRLDFADYDATTGKPISTSGYTSLLRNHIYRYNIKSVGVSAAFELEVLPWELFEDEEWEYTDNVVMNDGGWLKWTLPGVNMGAVYPNEARLVMPGGTTVTVTGTFTISAPQGGEWYATFRPLVVNGHQTRTDAFIFVDEEGNPLDEDGSQASGLIGQEATIYIRNKYADTGSEEVNYEALLVVMVKTLDGRWMEADIVEGNPTNYTIVQSGL